MLCAKRQQRTNDLETLAAQRVVDVHDGIWPGLRDQVHELPHTATETAITSCTHGTVLQKHFESLNRVQKASKAQSCECTPV